MHTNSFFRRIRPIFILLFLLPALCAGCSSLPVSGQATEQALPESFKEAWLKHALIRRLGDPRDQANAIVFFASDESAWITGQLMEVCGGYGLAAPMFGDIMEPNR